MDDSSTAVVNTRIGRQLRSLPTTTALFSAGKLSWSKIRVIARVADAVHEKTLSHAALDASASEVNRLCDGYRWKNEHNGDGENERALKQWEPACLILKKNCVTTGSLSLKSASCYQHDTDSALSTRKEMTYATSTICKLPLKLILKPTLTIATLSHHCILATLHA